MTKRQNLKRPVGGGAGSRSTLYIILAIIVLASVYGLAFVGGGGAQNRPAAPPPGTPLAHTQAK